MAIATHDQIANRAFEIYKARGANPGREMDDWLQAEKELKSEPKGEPKASEVPRPPEEMRPQESRRMGGRQPQRMEQPSSRQA